MANVLPWRMAAAETDWDAVYTEQLPRVYNFFRYRFGNEALAEDLTSRTFEKAWSGARYRRDLAGFATWLFSIARNVAVDHLRAQRPHVPLEAAENVPGEGDAAGRSRALLRHRAARRARRAAAARAGGAPLKYGAEATNRAIAELTGLSESNVGTILHRVVQTLPRLVTNRGIANGRPIPA